MRSALPHIRTRTRPISTNGGSGRRPTRIHRSSVVLQTPIRRATSPVVKGFSIAGSASMHTVLVYQYLECNQNPHLEHAQQENILNRELQSLRVLVHLRTITIRQTLLHDLDSSAHLVPKNRFGPSSASCRVISGHDLGCAESASPELSVPLIRLRLQNRRPRSIPSK